MPEIMIPMVVSVTFFALIGLIFYYFTATRHKERMAMLQTGLSAEQMKSLRQRMTRTHSPLSSLKWGIIIVAIGLAIIVGNFLREMYNVDESIVAGVVFLFAGIALVIFYVIASKKMQEPSGNPEE